MAEKLDDKILYPQGLYKWAGHSDGGVKLPFFDGLGRPAGRQFITPLVCRMDKWARSISANDPAPRIIFLVGGPGNGKTDTVESAVHSLDQAFQLNGTLVEAARAQYQSSENSIPPRKVTINLTRLGLSSKYTSLSIVQDATETDPQVQLSCEQLLLRDLLEAKRDELSIYLCCVNRGILAQAARLAEHDNQDEQRLLASISDAVTNKPVSMSCWPLSSDSDVAAWPMDAESLVKSTNESVERIADQILDEVLSEENWSPSCDLGSMCPYCQNRKALSNRRARDSFVELLYFYELRSGQRWTFRDLFSLISYMLIGDPKELEIKGKCHSPCSWSASMFAIYEDNTKSKADRTAALAHLVSRLYHHRLFPVWPGFTKGAVKSAKTVLKECTVDGNDLDGLKGFLAFFSSKKREEARISGDVLDRVRGELSPMLDPSLAEGHLVLLETSGTPVNVRDLEDLFSVSVLEGKTRTRHQLQSLEIRLLDELQSIDLALDTENFPSTRSRDVYLLKSLVRQYALRVSKRSLGTRNSVFRKLDSLRKYAEAIHDDAALGRVLKNMSKLLHDERNNFRAHLATTFGQPVAERTRDISLLVQKKVNIRPVAVSIAAENSPPQPLPYVKIESHYLGLTFDLFDSLLSVANGLHPASLPADTYALLDRVKSLVAGEVVRDPGVIEDDPVLLFGGGYLSAEYREGRFFVEKAEKNGY
ncbi:hypothetical protein [Spongiibacter sp.]|uniref:hypothetical protein n=1 Tax=Spongiibacter sp. TaxID=2024860 RepID=UPI000C54F9A6|nr:hypothetical protein [Spongiibacter sp.]MBU71682.1 hypothetical protein [Spongiibacter sp.]